MAHKSSFTQGTNPPSATGVLPQLVQLSDGTLVGIFDDTTTSLVLRYSTDRVTWTTVDTITCGSGTGFNTATSAGLAVDSLDNIYLAGPQFAATPTNYLFVTYTKGAGLTWTKQTATLASALSTIAATTGRVNVFWCNTGGGTSNKGHLLLAYQAATVGNNFITVDAGALLAGTAIALIGNVRNPTMMPTATPFYVSPDGFGGTQGLVVQSSSALGQAVGKWVVSSTGTFSTNAALANTAGSMTFGYPVWSGSNRWTILGVGTATTIKATTYSFTAQITAVTTSGALTTCAYPTTTRVWGLYDPQSAKVWAYCTDASLGTTIRREGIAVASGITFDGAATQDDTGVGTNSLGSPFGGVDLIRTGAKGDYYAGIISTAYVNYTSFNSAPNAPTLTAPSNASSQDLAAGFTFSWTFSDPDAGDTQSAYALRRKISGAGSYEWWNVGTGAWQSTEVYNASVSSSITFAAAKWTNGNVYNWSVSTKDAAGAIGPYATDATVTATTAAVVTVIAPTGTYTTSTQPTVTWSESDAESDAQQTYQVKVESGAFGTTPGAGTAAWDSTEVTDASARAATVAVALASGTSYRFFVRVKTNGQYSLWAYSTATLALSLPAVPTLAAALDTPNGRVMLTLQGRDNLLSVNTSSIETDTTGWAVAANATLSRSTAQFLDGAASLQLQSVAGGNMSATTPTGTSGISVAPSTTYTALVSMRSAVSVRSCRIDVAWYTSAGALISTTLGTAANDATGSWVQVVCAAASPANAAFAALIVNVLATGAAAEVHFADQISLAPGSSTTWTRGGLFGLTVVIVEYQSTTGAWVAIRNSPFNVDANQAATVYDYEAPNHTLRTYRASTQATI